MKTYNYEDKWFPNNGHTHTRKIVRGFIKTSNGNYAFHHIQGKDLFGLRDYYETPGGGVDEGESLENALRREMREELGYEIKNISLFARVDDYYNAIYRKNENYYFLAEIDGDFKGLNHQSKGDDLIESTIWCDLDTALSLYCSKDGSRISSIVCQREIPLIRGLIELKENK